VEENTLTVLLIEDSPQYAQLVQHWLAPVTGGAGFVLNWTDSLADGMTRLERGGVDVILLDLGLPDCSGMDTFTQTRARAPKTPIVILSSADSEALALQMIQEGAEDYLVKSNCDAEALKRAVRRAVVRRKSLASGGHASSVSGRVLSVVGAKGGCGATTIASTLAAELHQQTVQKVLFADLDPSGGLGPFLLGVDCKYSMRDAVVNLQRLDLNCWESLVAKDDPAGLEVIASGTLDQPEIDGASLRDVLAFTRTLYPWSVLDLGRLSHQSLGLLGPESEVLLVTASTIPALYTAKRTVESLRVCGIDSDHIRLIVNHTAEKQMLSGDTLNQMFGVPVYATIPSDALELHQACVQKRLAGPNSPLRKAIAGLARKITGLPEQRKSTLISLVSFAERFRKSAENATVSQGS
jgi:Flp pilus assembly CpaE family ATPase